MPDMIKVGGLAVARSLHELVTQEIAPGSGVEPAQFWQALERGVERFAPRNRELLQIRERLQTRIDQWHLQHRGRAHDPVAYKAFLKDIGYLLPACEDFTIDTPAVDAEIRRIAGPQLVVPVMNARYALNATNARWGSLYDSLYGTDAISEDDGAERTRAINPRRVEKVVAYSMDFLDFVAALAQGSYHNITAFAVRDQQLVVSLGNGAQTTLNTPAKFVGYTGGADKPSSVVLRNNCLHLELLIDPQHEIGRFHPAGIRDVIMEAAVTTIQDCEDSVAAVDARDKVEVYRNWLGLMKGDLSIEFHKNGRTLVRRLNPDREYIAPDGGRLVLHGRSLLLVRNVGLLMTTDAVLDQQGHEIPEGILDGFVTALAALHDLQAGKALYNSRSGHVYIVKPKLHGPAEVAFTNDLFDFIEDALGLPRYTLNMGIMDEERRTSVNLKHCIHAARKRLVFINTGFLDRTGDEIHTSMEAGPMVMKEDMKDQLWLQAYEDSNVDIGLRCGLHGKAQIGKGMWAMPDAMHDMLESKIEQVRAGANTAWVPSPTAAVLHALHYHQVNVYDNQTELLQRAPASVDDILTIPLLGDQQLTPAQIEAELCNNAQGILGYVVRWVEQGVGCSKVPNIQQVDLMEDRATLRISSQHIANWLHHGICTEAQVRGVLERMAVEVDRQNAGDPLYRNMAPDFDRNVAFQAACDLVFKGREQPNGYTEPLLHRRRKQAKA